MDERTMDSIALLLSSEIISATRLAIIVVINVDTAHSPSPWTHVEGDNGEKFIERGETTVAIRREKGIDQSMGGSLTFLVNDTIEKASPIYRPKINDPPHLLRLLMIYCNNM